MPTAASVSFRLGGPDGVSIEAEKWRWALTQLGFGVVTVAGAGPVDRPVAGLDVHDPRAVDEPALAGALEGADLTVVENVCSLPLNPPAAEAVSHVLRGRRTLLRHHDLPWQRARFTGSPNPPDDPAWLHVTINKRSEAEMRQRGLAAHAIYNRVAEPAALPSRAAARATFGFEEAELVVIQPTRALARKNIAAAISLSEALGATYWLTGPAEEGYGPTATALLGGARCPTRWDHGLLSMDAAYAAADLVVLPSTWEGFGLPTIESAVHRRPLAIGSYPVAEELRGHGFRWFGLDETEAIRRYLSAPDCSLIEHNAQVARSHFSLDALPADLTSLFDQAGWSW
ncbi:MAG: hypothetical protein ACR2H3_05850 [Acidimicrobiales bacterium]